MESPAPFALLLALGLAGACGSGSLGGNNPVSSLQQSCPVGAAAAASDGGPGACSISAAYLSCEGPAGGCGCPSGNGTSCSSGDQCGPTNGMTCTNPCQTNEYAMACGGPPRSDGTPYQQAPSNCRAVLFTPAGVVEYCCPCQ